MAKAKRPVIDAVVRIPPPPGWSHESAYDLKFRFGTVGHKFVEVRVYYSFGSVRDGELPALRAAQLGHMAAFMDAARAAGLAFEETQPGYRLHMSGGRILMEDELLVQVRDANMDAAVESLMALGIKYI